MDSLLLQTTRHQRRCLSQHWRHCWRQCELVGPTSKSHHHNQLTRPDLELCSDSIPCNKQPQYLTSNRSLSVTKITREDTLFTYACKISSPILRKCHWLSSVTVCTIQMLWLLLLLFTIIVIIIKYSKRHARKNKISHWIHSLDTWIHSWWYRYAVERCDTTSLTRMWQTGNGNTIQNTTINWLFQLTTPRLSAYIVLTLRVRKINLSGITLANLKWSGPNLVHMHRSTGDNVPENWGGLANWGA